MIYIDLAFKFKGRNFFFSPIFGLLLQRKIKRPNLQERGGNFNDKLGNAILTVNKPYLFSKKTKVENVVREPHKLAILYAKFLVFLGKRSFLLSYLLCKVRFPVYENSLEAVMVFRSVFSHEEQSNLCLPRALFVAVTSKTFKKKGVAFIGVFLPLKHMHAWIIEDGINVDPLDDMWICYKPVAALC